MDTTNAQAAVEAYSNFATDMEKKQGNTFGYIRLVLFSDGSGKVVQDDFGSAEHRYYQFNNLNDLLEQLQTCRPAAKTV